MVKNITLTSVKFILIELIGDVLYFPVWWYTRGAKKTILFFWQKIIVTENALGVRIWVTSLFKPMYAQKDWQSKIISFFMRIFQIIIRTIAFAVVFIFWLTITLIWLALPIIVVRQVYVNIF